MTKATTRTNSGAAIVAAAALLDEGTTRQAPGTAEITADTIRTNITDGMALLSQAFLQMEQRIVADNGKRYPIDATLPDGVSDSGSIELVNRFAFIERQLVGTVVWKLETMVASSAERVSQQRDKIRQAVRQIDSGRTDAAIVERMADFLETLVEQHAMLVAAFNSALDAHAGILGEDFETKAMRDERARLAQSKPSQLTDRLKALGC